MWGIDSLPFILFCKLKELRHDLRMCEIWLHSHWDSNASAILNLSELSNFVRIKPFLVKIITSFCRLCEILFVDLLSLSQRQHYGRRRGKAYFGGEFPSTSLRDRSVCVSCFEVSGNMLQRNGYFTFSLNFLGKSILLFVRKRLFHETENKYKSWLWMHVWFDSKSVSKHGEIIYALCLGVTL